MAKNPNITIKKISELIDVTLKGIEWQIANLKKHGNIKRVGPDKGGYWKVIKQKNN